MTYPFRDPIPILAAAAPEVPVASDPRQSLDPADSPWLVLALLVVLVLGVGCLILGAAAEANRRRPSFYIQGRCICGHVEFIHDDDTGPCYAASGCSCRGFTPAPAVSR